MPTIEWGLFGKIQDELENAKCKFHGLASIVGDCPDTIPRDVGEGLYLVIEDLAEMVEVKINRLLNEARAGRMGCPVIRDE